MRPEQYNICRQTTNSISPRYYRGDNSGHNDGVKVSLIDLTRDIHVYTPKAAKKIENYTESNENNPSEVPSNEGYTFV